MTAISSDGSKRVYHFPCYRGRKKAGPMCRLRKVSEPPSIEVEIDCE